MNSVQEMGEEKEKARGDWLDDVTKARGDWLDDVTAPEAFEDDVRDLVRGNKDLFAQSDAELGHTDTVRMKIDTGEHPLLR